MWLINVETRNLEEFIGSADRIPQYAALSHTWEDGQEVSFQEYRRFPTGDDKTGYMKIEMTCRQAARDGLQYAWVETCCIDKSSSAELSEAINSMFNWYKRSTHCYVYLRDLSTIPGPEFDKMEIAHCVWFGRGWTLQELIAPSKVKFYNQDWRFCFTKLNACAQLSTITGVDIGVLTHEQPLSTLSIAQKMSWAASRKTTRVEDMAYCLLGIFDINMPLLYGEEEKSFLRLQEEIIKSCPDPSIFGWALASAGAAMRNTSDLLSGVLAPSPKAFGGCGEMDMLPPRLLPEFSTTNRGIKLRANFGRAHLPHITGNGYIIPVCQLGARIFAIQTRNIGEGIFVRQDPTTLVETRSKDFFNRLILEPYLLTQLADPSGLQQVKDFRLARRRCIQIRLPPGMYLNRRWPWHQWDEVDTVFFSSEEWGAEWSALKIVATQPIGRSNVPQPWFDFLFYAFNWSNFVASQPNCMVHRVRGDLHDRYLEDMNDRAVTEDWDSCWVSNRLKMSEVPEKSTIEVNGSDGNKTLLTFKLNWVKDQNVCATMFWRVTFDLQLVRSDRRRKA